MIKSLLPNCVKLLIGGIRSIFLVTFLYILKAKLNIELKSTEENEPTVLGVKNAFMFLGSTGTEQVSVPPTSAASSSRPAGNLPFSFKSSKATTVSHGLDTGEYYDISK